mgnify:CR=1 FL=1
MNEEQKKKEYVKPEMEIMVLQSKMDLLQGSCDDCEYDGDEAEIGSIPVFIDPKVIGA